jgi:DNA-directed RNA polymerase subunit RPC12/RpoP
VKNEVKKCPRCGAEVKEPTVRYCALSRRDNKTYICSSCGTLEALEDARMIAAYDGAPYWKEKQ